VHFARARRDYVKGLTGGRGERRESTYTASSWSIVRSSLGPTRGRGKKDAS